MADAFDASKVTKIYLGKDRYCRCGCAGEYVDRGEPMFEKRLQRFVKMWCDYTPDDSLYSADITDTYRNISYGQNRAMTVYFD